MLVYILQIQRVFFYENGNSYQISITRTRFFAIAAGNDLRQVKGDQREKYKGECRDALTIIVCDQNNILLRDIRKKLLTCVSFLEKNCVTYN